MVDGVDKVVDAAAGAVKSAANTVNDAASTAAAKAKEAAQNATEQGKGFWQKLVKPEGYLGKISQDGFTKTIKDNFNPKSAGNHGGYVFSRVLGTGVGVYAAGDAIFCSKRSDGEDRSGLARVGEFILGGGLTAASALGGKVRI